MRWQERWGEKTDGTLGGLMILAAVSCLCLKGMKRVDARLKVKKENWKK